MHISTPIVGFSGTPIARSAILASAIGARNAVMPWDADDRAKYGSTYAEWSPERQAHNLTWQKAKRDRIALAEGREPGRVGRPPRLTAEEKEASRKAQNRKRSLRSAAKSKLKRAAKAIAEGREPGKVGNPVRLTPEQRVVSRQGVWQRYKAANGDAIRAQQAPAMRAKTAARALAEGRVPGIHGALARLTVAELEEYLRKWPDKNDVLHSRLKTQNSRAKRLGAPGILTVADVREVVIYQNGHCAFCDGPFGDELPEIDHWHPLARGGSNTPDNVRLLHMSCNRTKGAKLPAELGLTDPLEK